MNKYNHGYHAYRKSFADGVWQSLRGLSDAERSTILFRMFGRYEHHLGFLEVVDRAVEDAIKERES